MTFKAIAWIFFLIMALENAYLFEYTDNPTVEDQAVALLSERLRSTLNCTNEGLQFLNGNNSSSYSYSSAAATSLLQIPEVTGSSLISIVQDNPNATFTESGGIGEYILAVVQELGYNITVECLQTSSTEVRSSGLERGIQEILCRNSFVFVWLFLSSFLEYTRRLTSTMILRLFFIAWITDTLLT